MNNGFFDHISVFLFSLYMSISILLGAHVVPTIANISPATATSAVASSSAPTASSTPVTAPVFKPAPTPKPIPSATPHIRSISPSSGPVGTEVTLSGSAFTNDTLILFGGGPVKVFKLSGTASHATITFQIPQDIGPDCAPHSMCPMYLKQVTDGVYTVSLRNLHGKSNAVTFTVTENSISQ